MAIDVVVRARSSVRLTVERDARVSALVPPGTPLATFEEVVRSKRRWLFGKLHERRVDLAARPEKQLISGEGFHYLGRSYRLQLVDEAPAPVRLINGRLQLLRSKLGNGEQHLIRWYAARGQAWLPRRAQPWAERMRAPFSTLRVRQLGYRWGSCSPDGSVNIHWATMQLSVDVVDYVLVHELAHLHQHDHSPAFWRTVERAMPDFVRHRDRLRVDGAGLWIPESQ
jgi:hypothetical protein